MSAPLRWVLSGLGGCLSHGPACRRCLRPSPALRQPECLIHRLGLPCNLASLGRHEGGASGPTGTGSAGVFQIAPSRNRHLSPKCCDVPRGTAGTPAGSQCSEEGRHPPGYSKHPESDCVPGARRLCPGTRAEAGVPSLTLISCGPQGDLLISDPQL